MENLYMLVHVMTKIPKFPTPNKFTVFYYELVQLNCMSRMLSYKDINVNSYLPTKRDAIWSLTEHVRQLKTDLKTWRLVYWRLWGQVCMPMDIYMCVCVRIYVFIYVMMNMHVLPKAEL